MPSFQTVLRGPRIFLPLAVCRCLIVEPVVHLNSFLRPCRCGGIVIIPIFVPLNNVRH